MRTVLAGMIAAVLVGWTGIAAAEERSVDCHQVKTDACWDLAAHPLPTSPDEAKKLRDEIAKEPYGGAAMLAYALMVWQADEELGKKLMVLAVSEKKVTKVKKGDGTYGGYDLNGSVSEYLRMAARNKHCMRSYAVGATPDNDYAIPDVKAVVLRFRKQEKYVGSVDSGSYKVFLCTSGADSCRPITTTMNKNGVWKADEMSSLFSGCRPMKSQERSPGEDDAADKL
jgi:hypothetical protein